MNRVLLALKAQEIAVSIIFDSFKASNGWLAAFQCCQNLKFKKLSSGSNAMDLEAVANWKLQLGFLLHNYALKDIFNMDETGLFCCGLPRESMSEKKEQAKGGKLIKKGLP